MAVQPLQGFAAQPAIRQLLDAVGQPAFQKTPIIGGRLRVKQFAPAGLLGWPAGAPFRAVTCAKTVSFTGLHILNSLADMTPWRRATVERSLCDAVRFLTGLPVKHTLEAPRQNAGEFGEWIVVLRRLYAVDGRIWLAGSVTVFI